MAASAMNRRLTVSIPIQVASIVVTVVITISRTCISGRQSQDSAGSGQAGCFTQGDATSFEQLLDAVVICLETELLVWQVLRTPEQQPGRGSYKSVRNF